MNIFKDKCTIYKEDRLHKPLDTLNNKETKIHKAKSEEI